MLIRRPLAITRLPVGVELTRTAAKWAWLRDERARQVEDAALWVALTDYPAVRWSGRPFMSRTLAARTACYDPVSRAWLPALLQDCGAPPLPSVMSGGSVVGRVRSDRLRAAGVVSPDTVVVAGGHDHPMGASLVCGSVPGAILDSMGTAELAGWVSVMSIPVDWSRGMQARGQRLHRNDGEAQPGSLVEPGADRATERA